ncbi:tetratricopeptide repeat-containing sulfotransferase family protein [Psychromarinibacter sp. S121]|uniref:tetratricopeptide repeat-containing sulfotransferase family protein n=1 Tax=Psychromarinibacter sp. S121 TaxID=3415127 RepID=UPI003C7A9A2C
MLPLGPAQIPALIKQARALEGAGQLEQARAKYANALAIDARLAPAMFQMAQIDFKLQRFDSAAGLLDRALKLKPGEQALWGLYVRVLEKLDDRARTASFLERAKAAPLPPKFVVAMQDALTGSRTKSRVDLGGAPPAEVQKAIRMMETGDPAGAVRVVSALRRSHPDVALLADILANAQAVLGNTAEADAAFHDTIRLAPDYAEGLANYGAFLQRTGRPTEAIPHLQRAVKLMPRMTRAWVALGAAMVPADRPGPQAEAALRKALALDPKHPQALLELAQLQLQEHQAQQAVETVRAALKAGADPEVARLCLGRALAELGDETGALAEFDALLAANPDFGPAYTARGGTLQTLGRFDEAHADFRKALEIMPKNGESYRIFLLAEKISADDPLIPQMETLVEDETVTEFSRANIGFALAKAMEDTKQYDRVFTYLRPANDLTRKLHPYDIAERRDRIDAIRTAFGGRDLPARKVAGTSDFAPIFVTGLPRSGTTLVEQIIASHSRVTGGGELGYLPSEVERVLAGPDHVFHDIDKVSDADIARAGKIAAERMLALHPGADIVTDKSVQSYLMIGPIRMALPKSRIVVVQRDPRDNLLSIYRNMFAPGLHLYSYDLKDLAAYYHLYEEILAFWRAEAPGWFYEIRYEDLIADPEAQSRALIEACGLEWEDACLNFHENKRRVDTLSVHQVRQPIYKSSLKAWERYGSEIDELLDALGGDYARKD